MRKDEAVDLVRAGVPPGGGAWADLGAGTGTFTRALAELLGRDGEIWAVDRDEGAVRALRRLRLPAGTVLHVLEGDFTRSLSLPALDGVLMANSLHFAEDQEAVLRRVSGYVRPGGRLLLVEYDRTVGSRWVPYPVPPERFRKLCARIRLPAPGEVGRRRSSYGREMYAAVVRVPGRRPEDGAADGPAMS